VDRRRLVVPEVAQQVGHMSMHFVDAGHPAHGLAFRPATQDGKLLALSPVLRCGYRDETGSPALSVLSFQMAIAQVADNQREDPSFNQNAARVLKADVGPQDCRERSDACRSLKCNDSTESAAEP
jgi:hypothetical protein